MPEQVEQLGFRERPEGEGEHGEHSIDSLSIDIRLLPAPELLLANEPPLEIGAEARLQLVELRAGDGCRLPAELPKVMVATFASTIAGASIQTAHMPSCGNASPLLGCAEQSSPKAACGAPKARGLTAKAQTGPS